MNAKIKSADKFSTYHILLIVLLSFTQFTVVLDFMIISPLGDMVMKSMQLTPAQFGLCVAGYALMAGVSGMLTAGFADRYDRKKLLLFFYAGFIIGTILCGLTTSYAMLLFARIVTGFFGGVIGSVSLAIVADVFPLEKRGRVMAFVQMGFAASQVLGIPIGLLIANAFNWQMPFFMIGGVALIVCAVIVLKMKPITEHLAPNNKESAIAHFWETVSNSYYRSGFLATALLSLGGFLLIPWASAFAINNLSVTKPQLPVLFMITGICSIIVMPIIGKVSDKVDKFKIFAIASVCAIAMIIIYTNLTKAPFWQIALLNASMMVCVLSRVIPATALTTALPDIHDRGAYMSISSSLQQIAGGFAAGIGGLIIVQHDKLQPIANYNILGYLSATILVASILAILRVNVRVTRHKQINDASKYPEMGII
jgi:multidrug resistance protein